VILDTEITNYLKAPKGMTNNPDMIAIIINMMECDGALNKSSSEAAQQIASQTTITAFKQVAPEEAATPPAKSSSFAPSSLSSFNDTVGDLHACRIRSSS